MKTRRENANRNSGMVLIVGLTLLVLGLLASTAYALTPYDDFATGTIDPTKWKDLETRTEISGGQLLSAVRGSGINTWNNQNITGTLSGQVYYIEADVTLHSASGDYDASDTTKSTFPRARIWGQFFNDGTGSLANPIGEVTAGVSIGLYRGQLKARWRVASTVDYPPTIVSEIAGGFFDLTINQDQAYRLTLRWDPASKLFTFTVGSEVHTYTYEGDQATPVLGGKGVGTYAEIPEGSVCNGSVCQASIQAYFDNVTAKALSGSTLMTDNFSGTYLDPAKWGTFEMRRDITSQQLRLKARAPASSSAPVTQPALTVVDPENVKTLQAKVQVASVDAQNSAAAQARVGGRFFNDGSSGGGYVGDIQAWVTIGMTQGSLTASWRVIRHTDSTNSNSSTVLASGTFGKTVSTGTPYLLNVTWNGTTFTFTIANSDGSSPEPATYAPTGPFKAPNKPFKGVYVRTSATSGNSAAMEAYFDDVQVEYLAGGTISGYVKDILTEQGISGATVTIKKSNVFVTSASTDGTGLYTTTVSSDGDYTVEASATGYILISAPQPVGVYVSTQNQTANLLMYNSAATPSLALYEDFSAPSIDKNKWSTFEFVREIVPVSLNNQLRLKIRNGGGGGRFYSNLWVPNPAAVTSIKVDLTPTSYQNLQGASAWIGLGGRFYNVGFPMGDGMTGDVQAVINFGGSGPSMVAYCQVFTAQNSDGSSTVSQFYQTFPTPSLNTSYTATVSWNSSTNTFTFTLGGTTYTYTDNRSKSAAQSPFVGPYTVINNGSGMDAVVEGYVDNVYVNGALYDDFSASTVIDATKWSTQEFVREVTADGKLRMKLRGVNTDQLSDYLSVLYPDSLNTLQTKMKVPLNGYTNANSATLGAGIHGAFYNDGTSGGGLQGDVHAMVAIGGTGTSPQGGWFVFKCTDPTDIWQNTLLAAGPFAKSISTGTEYTLRVGWDGSKLTFRIADADGTSNAEEHTYTPATTISPPNYPWKMLWMSADTGSNKDATIEALFDDVMANSGLPQGISFWPGWNFITLPLRPADTSIGTLLGPILSKVAIVWAYDTTSRQWLKYRPGGSSNNLTAMDAGKGYWVYGTDTAFISLTGGTALTPPIHLLQGFNLVGYEGQTCVSVTTALAGLAGKWVAVWAWEGGEWSARFASGLTLSGIDTLTTLCPGKAYWIMMNAAGDWTW